MEQGNGQYWALIERIGRAGTLEALRAATMDAFSAAGFGAAYFLAPVVADPRVARTLTSIGLPTEWDEAYRAEMVGCDPLPRIAMTRRSAFVWPDDILATDLSPDERACLAQMADHGLDRGIAVPCFGPFARCGFVGVGLPAAGNDFGTSSRLKVEVAARTSFKRYTRLAEPFADDVPELSPREAEVLGLMAQGKSNSVIAQILGVSPSSVDVYVKRLFAKLGVTDRTSASVKALAMGLIVAGDWPDSAR